MTTCGPAAAGEGNSRTCSSAGLSSADQPSADPPSADPPANASDRLPLARAILLAHELKAPLHAIAGYLDLLRQDESPARQEIIDRCQLRLEGMEELITDFLHLARLDSQDSQAHSQALEHPPKDPTRRQLVDLREKAKETVALFAPDAARRGLTLTLQGSGPVRVAADPADIEIILNNLISNAIKYNRPGGSVTVGVTRFTEAAHIIVIDTGIGLTPEEAAQVFDEFVRVKNEDTLKTVGSGLGLTIVRRLAQRYGGDVIVKSTRGTGSTFTVTLPAPAAPPHSA